MFGADQHSNLDGIRRKLFAYARALCRDRHAAEDLYQDALLRAMSAKDVPAGTASFRVWMFRLLRNLWIDNLRTQKRREAVLTRVELTDISSAGHSGNDPVLDRLAIREAFMQLSKEHRDVLALVDIGGFSYEETAELLGIPRGTVMSRVSRGRVALAAQLVEGNVVAFPTRRGRA